MSTVTVFNCYNESITKLSVGGYNAGDIKPWADGSNPPPAKYTPSSIAVQRSKAAGTDPTFAIGDNQLNVPWESFKGTTTVTIPDPKNSDVSLADDLLLFVTVSNAILVTTRGFVKGTFPIILKDSAGESVSAE